MRAQTKKAKKQKNRNKEKALTIPPEAFQSKSDDSAEAEEAMIIDQETDWLRRQENQSRKRKHEGTVDTKAVEEKAKKVPSSSSSSNSPPFETSSAVTRRDESDIDHGVLSFHKKHFNIQKSKSQSTDRKSINREAAEGRLSEYEEEELAKMLEAAETLLSMGKK